MLNMHTVSGDFRDFTQVLSHGLVTAMSRKSRDTWRHAIDRDLGIRDTRVSFTFRQIKQIPPADSKHNIPKVAKPEPPAGSNIKRNRVLFLTDSLYWSTPEHVFSTIPGYTCVKKVNFQLKDILNF